MDKIDIPDVNFITVLWRGDFRNRNYSIKHLDLLRGMIRRWTAGPYGFHVLANDPEGIPAHEYIPQLYPELKGWWPKLELFRDDLPLNGRCIYMDLDLIITGALNPLIEHPGKLVFMKPIDPAGSNNVKLHSERQSKEGMTVHYAVQSSVFAWDFKEVTLPYPEIVDMGLQEQYRGDQDVFGKLFKGQFTQFPAGWFQKLRDCYSTGPGKQTKVVLGNPKKLYKKAMKDKSWQKYLK